MKREQLEEIRARAEAATEGPWYYGGDTRVAQEMFQNHELIVSPTYPLMEFEPSEQGEADAEFAAHARTDVPALLDEIDRLTRELDTMREVAQGNKRHVAYLMTEIERGVPVSLGTECLRCRHVYNWHSNANGWCAVVVDGQQCGCYFVAPTTAEGSAEGGTSKGSEVTP